jgi:hypothetical protein
VTGRLDRFGEIVEPEPEPEDDHSRCRGGWLTDFDSDRPVPCPQCKPHLARLRAELRRRLEGPRP